jgi:hypothetical protein
MAEAGRACEEAQKSADYFHGSPEAFARRPRVSAAGNCPANRLQIFLVVNVNIWLSSQKP